MAEASKTFEVSTSRGKLLETAPDEKIARILAHEHFPGASIFDVQEVKEKAAKSDTAKADK